MINKMNFKPLKYFLLEQPRNGLYKGKEWQGSGNRWIKMKEVFSMNFISNDETSEKLEVTDSEIERFSCKTGDLLFGRTSLTLEGVGDCLLVKDITDAPIFESNLFRIRFDIEKAYPLFFYYFFKSHYGRQTIQRIAKQTAATSITANDLIEEDVPSFPIDKQVAIADLIYQFDKKISSNQKTNQTLEQMAQALFKSWFVDFDPVIDNALAAGNPIPDALQTRAELRKKVIAERATNPKLRQLPEDIQQLFPSEFEHCGDPTIGIAGWIPKGWECCPMSEIVDIASSKRVFAKDYVQAGVPFFRGKEISELSKGNKINTEIFISEDKYQELKEKAGAPKQGDILITSVGTIGNIYLVKESDKFYFKDGNLTWVKGYKKGFIPFYLKEWFKSKKAKDAIERIKIGTTQQAITIKALNGVTMLSPESKLVQIFEKQAVSIFNKHNANIEQIGYLSKLRDSLLPKLISGELQLDSTTSEPIDA